jgi:hypothetical protein
MRITLDVTSYNPRRYGKPWIARVDFGSDPKGDFHFGDFVGDPGQAGVLVIEVNEGDIVAWGQKDYRGHNSEILWHQVRDGRLVKLGGKAEAYKLSISKEK